jgi:hypothetical protein
VGLPRPTVAPRRIADLVLFAGSCCRLPRGYCGGDNDQSRPDQAATLPRPGPGPASLEPGFDVARAPQREVANVLDRSREILPLAELPGALGRDLQALSDVGGSPQVFTRHIAMLRPGSRWLARPFQAAPRNLGADWSSGYLNAS